MKFIIELLLKNKQQIIKHSFQTKKHMLSKLSRSAAKVNAVRALTSVPQANFGKYEYEYEWF